MDSELVRRGLARSREQAAQLIEAGRVSVQGRPAGKPATQVDLAAAIVVAELQDGPDYVSRGAYKLIGALDVFGGDVVDEAGAAGSEMVGGVEKPGAAGSGGVAFQGSARLTAAGTGGVGRLEKPGAAGSEGVAFEGSAGLTVLGRRCLDAGASTGGFTDVLLRRGAAHVVAVDVGYGQLAWSLRTDDRVSVLERVNVRDLTPEMVGEPPSLVVGDLSFISLRLVLPPLVACAAPGADFVLLVKPQFEVGKDRVGAGGVVRDPALRAEVVRDVATAAQRLGLTVKGVTASPLPGPSGNVEYLLWLGKGTGHRAVSDLGAAIARAVEEGPQ
ncbi:TlyA family RNA methyltransferase [Streptosporangiaceae bacterium NEAU-GS5]|nr:TlyA family RNA methyltransferase [Streptosporangiaceae bacterium NEAU-GS5]